MKPLIRFRHLYVLRLVVLIGTACVVSFLSAPPAPGATWQYGPSMPIPCGNIDAAKDLNGLIYIAGGKSTATGVLSTVMRFDETAPAGSQWSLVAPLNTARCVHAVTADALGRIYAIGGTTVGEVEVLSSVERYYPATDSWYISTGTDDPLLPSLPVAVRDCHAVTDSLGRIYVVGGMDENRDFLSSVYMYDSGITDPGDPGFGWQLHSSMNMTRSYFGLVIDDQDRIYAIGGEGVQYEQLDSVERYDPVTGTWTVLDDTISSARLVGTAVIGAGGNVFAIGGWMGGPGPYTNVVDRFNPATGTWEIFDPLNQAKNNMAGILGNSGNLYVFGGDSNFTSQSNVEYLPIPEPSVLGLMFGGLLFLFFGMARRRSS